MLTVKNFIRITKILIGVLVICLIGSILIDCGYLVVCSAFSIGISVYVLQYLRDVQRETSRVKRQTLKNIQYAEQSIQLNRDELFHRYSHWE